ncbi:hypothetical protein [Ammoniphilus resinae]|uniref:Uncharacterized protein n=1 Tax=Ammoniphilus resinae TaxID=861532 RepID=A0ABS4GNV7_9BACL|nr:hypothetical protein [Ammoniphilus resinae]MBP1931968.1 hypothetical protein [Ammoniphilus resinae]
MSDAYIKASQYRIAVELFKPYRQGIFNAQVLNEKPNKERIKFQYKTEKIAVFEAINEYLLHDYNSIKEKLFSEAEGELARKLNKNNGSIEDLSSGMAEININTYFDLPNELKIGKYTIEQIEKFWIQVMTAVYRCRLYNDFLKEESEPLLSIVVIDELPWSNSNLEDDTIQGLINDLTYVPNAKGRFTTLRTEPFVQLQDGRRVLSPSLAYTYNACRNVVSALYRKYGNQKGEEDNSSLKEDFFILELQSKIKKYTNLLTSAKVPLKEPLPDVDFVIYDKKTKSLVALELKWFTEPATYIEVKNKDLEIEKGLNQIIGYKSGILCNQQEFMLNAFGEKLPVKNLKCFVLTRITVGSGLIDSISQEDERVISIRIFLKALANAHGNLESAVNAVCKYFPKEGTHFKITNEKKSIGNSTVYYPAISLGKRKFSLE